VCVHKDFSFE
jgi:hypothetical protein